MQITMIIYFLKVTKYVYLYYFFPLLSTVDIPLFSYSLSCCLMMSNREGLISPNKDQPGSETKNPKNVN